MIPAIDQHDLFDAALNLGYIVEGEELACDPVTGEPFVVPFTLRILSMCGATVFVTNGMNEWSFSGWGDDLTITHLWDNPECVGCGGSTDQKDSLRCRPCTVKARAERQTAGVA